MTKGIARSDGKGAEKRTPSAVSVSTRRNRLVEGAAFGAIRVLSWTAVAILATIIGYMLFRGIVATGVERHPELRVEEREIAQEGETPVDAGPYVVIANSAASMNAIRGSQLFGAFTDEYLDWSDLDGRSDEIVPVAIDGTTDEGQAANGIVFGDPSYADFLSGGLVKVVADAEEAVAFVRRTRGAIGVVPARIAKGDGIKVLALDRLAAYVSPEVLEIRGNAKLSTLSETDWQRIVDGSVLSWSEVGGPDLPVIRAIPPRASVLAGLAAKAGFPAADFDPVRGASPVRYATTMEEYRGWFAAGDASGGTSSSGGIVGVEFSAIPLANGIPCLTVESSYARPNIDLGFIFDAPRLSGKIGGISTILLNTLFMIAVTALFAIPMGIGAAVYLVEYSRQGALVRMMRLGVETLAGIPSIVFGLFGMATFVRVFGLGLLSGSLTLSIMILPTIIRTAEEALKAVPAGLRESSLALGASRSRTVAKAVLPAASGGILSGVILGIGRALGETAALIFTMGSGYELATGLDSSARSLATHVYLLTAEGISFDRAFASALVLIVLVLIINTLAARVMSRARESS